MQNPRSAESRPSAHEKRPRIWCEAVGRRMRSAALLPLARSLCYQVREAMARNWATVETWEFRPPSTVTTWPVKYELSSEAR